MFTKKTIASVLATAQGVVDDLRTIASTEEKAAGVQDDIILRATVERDEHLAESSKAATLATKWAALVE